jgi:uncharacterized hydrophobic protein (TIGR00271 family)
MLRRLLAGWGLVGFDPGFLETFQTQLFIEGPQAAQRWLNFCVLLALSTVIATFGLISDSVATVIGAMIVAPLMTPIMALAAAITMGAPHRAIRALLQVIGGALGVIVLSAVLTFWIPDSFTRFVANQQITARITPGIFDLIVALAAGAAGSYALTRKEVSDSLPGVAIAISLVPPLCVVGVMAATGQWLAAAGALLLFITNFIAILLAGGAVFWLMGLPRLVTSDLDAEMRNRAVKVILGGTLVVALLLFFATWNVVRTLNEQVLIQTAVEQWLSESGYKSDSLDLTSALITVRLSGQGPVPDLKPLGQTLQAALGRPVSVTVRVVSEEVLSYPDSLPGLD